MTIQRKVSEVSGAGMVEGSTKTRAGRRTVTLPRRVMADLEQHRTAFGTGSLVFTSTDGAQVRANNLRRREWAAAIAQAGLDGLTFHGTRHTGVSLWVAAGASDLEVAKWADRSAAFTKTRYADLFPEDGEVLADRLDAFIAASTPTPAAAVAHLRPI